MGLEASTVRLPTGLVLSCASQGHICEPAVVLLPGPTDSWISYRPTLGRLPSSIRTVALSMRGHGDSDKPASGYRVDDFATDVVAALDTLDIGRAIVVGHSGSCLVARRVAIDHPDRVAGLVLEASPASLKGDAKLADFVDAVVSTLSDPVDPAFARSFLFATSSDDIEPHVADPLVEDLLKVPARVWQETFAGLLAYDDLGEVPCIAMPTLLVWGDRDGLVGREQQDRLLQLLPDASLRTYAGVGHTPRWEDPDRFAADLVAFVERLR